MRQQSKLRNLSLLTLSLLTTLFLSANAYADPIVKKERSVGNFTGINVGGAFNVVLKQTNSTKVVVEAEEDLHDDIRTEVKGGVLHIDMKWDWKWNKKHEKITLYINVDELDYLNVSGAADLNAEGSIRVDDLELECSGAGDIDLSIDAKSLDVTVSGAGDLRINGSTDRQKVRLSGAGDYKAGDLKSKYTYAKASGAGSVTVHASDEIEAFASGASSVRYYGNPGKERTSSSGAGSIRQGR